MRANHVGYINKLIYTDVESYEVFKENEQLMAVKVKREPIIKPEYVPGGFSAVCINERELYQEGNYKIVEEGAPFKLELMNGKYGYWGLDVICYGGSKLTEEEFLEEARQNGWDETKTKFICCKDGNGIFYKQVLLTPKGKMKRVFRKLGTRIEEKCKEYYDRNF